MMCSWCVVPSRLIVLVCVERGRAVVLRCPSIAGRTVFSGCAMRLNTLIRVVSTSRSVCIVASFALLHFALHQSDLFRSAVMFRCALC